jgi:formylglycine-generating enzyme required for sulfatase activity
MAQRSVEAYGADRFLKAAGLIGFFLGLVAFMAPAAAAGMTVPLHATESADAPVSETVSLYTRSYALVIGNDAYSGTWPRLSNAVKDAKLVAEALQAKGFEVTLKTNLDYRQLVEAFEKFFLETGEDPDARLLVWYAGHGYSERGEGYLVPVDALDPQEGGRFLRRVLSLRRMGEYVRGANALHVLAIFDSCFSGTIFNVGRAKPPPAITHATTRPVRQFLTSGDAGQTVSDDGTFRKLFIRAINGETRADGNGDGYLAATELGLFMANEITNYTGGRQTPRNGKLNDPDLDQGDFIFKVGPQAPQSPPAVGAAGSGQSVEMLFWQSIQASTVAGDYEAHLDRFPGGTFAPLARSRLAALSPPAASPQPAIPAGTAIRDCPECPELVTIPPGSFRMGDLEGTGRRNESPVHDVRLNVPPAIGRFEVTVGQFDAFVFATGYDTGNQCYVFDGRRWVDQPGKNWRDPGYQQSILDPVTCVSWEDAKAYAAWLTQKTGKTYRLPSEAEWEYAARAGTQARYAFNGGPNDLCAYGNGADRGSVFDWRNNDCSDGFSQRTSPAGKFRANGFGLHDMLGNLWEWVEDCSHDQYGGAPADGSAWVTGGDCGRRMLRGGSWDSRPENLRAAFRVGDRGNARYNFLGFRIARDL